MNKYLLLWLLATIVVIGGSFVLHRYASNPYRQARNHPDCIFCQIIAHKSPAMYIKETNDLIVINNIAPKAPIHYLIIPKKHIPDLQSLKDSERSLAANLLFMARALSEDLPADKHFKLISNNGSNAGQSVFHIHFHFISWGGEEKTWKGEEE